MIKMETKNGESLSSFKELCKFADEFDLNVELEKPFIKMENMFIKIINSNGEVIKQTTIDDILLIEKASAKILNELTKKENNGTKN